MNVCKNYFLELIVWLPMSCYNTNMSIKYASSSPASVAQLDALPVGDQEVSGATFFHGDGS